MHSQNTNKYLVETSYQGIKSINVFKKELGPWQIHLSCALKHDGLPAVWDSAVPLLLVELAKDKDHTISYLLS